jgi:site-specific recombinase XerD
MPRKIISELNYEDFCKELDISFEELQHYISTRRLANNAEIELKSGQTALSLFERFHLVLKNNEIDDQIKSLNTYKHYISFIERFKTFLSEVYPELMIEDLGMSQFNEFTDKFSKPKKPYKQRTKNSYLFIIRTLIGYFYNCKIIKIDTRYKFHKRSVDSLPRYFKDNEIRLILKKCINRTYGYRWRTIFITLLGTGLRIHELTKLKIKDVDLENNLIFTVGKGKKERYVPIYPQVKDEIKRYIQIQRINTTLRENYLFSREHVNYPNKPVSISSIQKMFKNIREEIKLDEHLTIHSFRHTFAVNCLKTNMRLEYLSQILGHKDPATTSIYTKLLPKDLSEEIANKYPIPFEKLLEEFVGDI